MIKKAKSLEGMLEEKCPKCGSEDVRILEASFPVSFECKKCGFIFMKTEKEREEKF